MIHKLLFLIVSLVPEAFGVVYEYYSGEGASSDVQNLRYVKRFQPQIFSLQELRELSSQPYLTVFCARGMYVPIHLQNTFLKTVFRFQSLRFLGLANIGLKTIPKFLLGMLESMPHLKMVDLSGNGALVLSSDGLEILKRLVCEGNIHFILDGVLQKKVAPLGVTYGWIKQQVGELQLMNLYAEEAEKDIQKLLDTQSSSAQKMERLQKNQSEKMCVRFSENVQSATLDLEDQETIPLREFRTEKTVIPRSYDCLLVRLKKAQADLCALNDPLGWPFGNAPEIYRKLLKEAVKNRDKAEWALIKYVLSMPFVTELQKAHLAVLEPQNQIAKSEALVYLKKLEDEIFAEVLQENILADFRMLHCYVLDGRRFTGESPEFKERSKFYLRALQWELLKGLMRTESVKSYPWEETIRRINTDEQAQLERNLERLLEYEPENTEKVQEIHRIREVLRRVKSSTSQGDAVLELECVENG